MSSRKLYVLLRQYRVIYVGMTFFIMFMCWEMWDFYINNHERLTVESAGAFASMFLAFTGMLKYSLENSRLDHKHDHKDDQ